MPESPIDIVEPDVRGELDGLRLLVEETDGSVIAFVRYRRVTEREAGVRYLKDQLQVPVEERVLSEERKNPLALLESVPDDRRCVQLYDLEAALPEVTGYLNVNREAYAEVPHALVFWVGEHGLREVATNAPDFWAWRSGVFDVRSDETDLTQSMSQVALADDVQFTDRGDLERRAELYESLIAEYEGKDEEYVAQLRTKLFATLYQLRRLERAEREAQKACKYAERENDREIAAAAYHQLGMIAQEQQEFEKAKKWYEKSLERQDDEHGAKTYHQLGNLAQEKREFKEAEEWYEKSLEIKDRQGNPLGAAKTYHQLGMIAQEQGQWEEAEEWYKNSLEISERMGDIHGAAKTYHQLGMIAQEQREFGKAKRRYKKSLKFDERKGDKHGAAENHHQLGMIAQEQGEFEKAKKWYEKSLEIKERQGNEHGAALTYGQLGILKAQQNEFVDAGHWLLRCITTFYTVGDQRGVRRNVTNFLRAYRQASPEAREEMRAMWIDAGLPEDELNDLLDKLHAEQSD